MYFCGELIVINTKNPDREPVSVIREFETRDTIYFHCDRLGKAADHVRTRLNGKLISEEAGTIVDVLMNSDFHLMYQNNHNDLWLKT